MKNVWKWSALVLPLALGACSKADDYTPQTPNEEKVLDKVIIQSISDKDGSGRDWDADGTGADIYLTLKQDGVPADTTAIAPDIKVANLPVTVGLGSFNKKLGKQSWFIRMMDRDMPEKSDQEMYTFMFNPTIAPNPVILEDGPYRISVYFKNP